MASAIPEISSEEYDKAVVTDTLGVLMVKYLEIGVLTPPAGLNVYVVKGVVGDAVSLGTVFLGVGWFLACEIIIMVLLIAFPQISLFLPGLMWQTVRPAPCARLR